MRSQPQQLPASLPAASLSIRPLTLLLLGPRNVVHVKTKRIAYDRVAVAGRNYGRLQLRFPMRRQPTSGATQIPPNLGRANFVASERNLEDRDVLPHGGLLL